MSRPVRPPVIRLAWLAVALAAAGALAIAVAADRTAHPSAPARESSDSRSARSTPPATLAAT